MRDFIELETTPSEEPCQQVDNKTDYMPRMRAEARAYVNQLIRVFGMPPAGASIRIKTNSHDFGSYLSLAVYYEETGDDNIDDEGEYKQTPSCAYAYKLEAEAPAKWDIQARQELIQSALNCALTEV